MAYTSIVLNNQSVNGQASRQDLLKDDQIHDKLTALLFA
jgi:hypothetical protein